MNILVVDDDEFTLKVLKLGLERTLKGMVIAAHDVRTALRLFDLHETELDAIVFDLHMPECDGVEFIEQLRQRDVRCRILIVSSAHDVIRRSAAAMCTAYGLEIVGCLKKPIDALAIYKALQPTTSLDSLAASQAR